MALLVHTKSLFTHLVSSSVVLSRCPGNKTIQATTGQCKQPAFLQPMHGKPWSELSLEWRGNCSSFPLPLPLPPVLNGADWEHMRRGGLEAFISISTFLVSDLLEGKWPSVRGKSGTLPEWPDRTEDWRKVCGCGFLFESRHTTFCFPVCNRTKPSLPSPQLPVQSHSLKSSVSLCSQGSSHSSFLQFCGGFLLSFTATKVPGYLVP